MNNLNSYKTYEVKNVLDRDYKKEIVNDKDIIPQTVGEVKAYLASMSLKECIELLK